LEQNGFKPANVPPLIGVSQNGKKHRITTADDLHTYGINDLQQAPDNLHNIRGAMELIIRLEGEYKFNVSTFETMVRIHLKKMEVNKLNGKDYRLIISKYNVIVLPCVDSERRNLVDSLLFCFMEIAFLCYVRDHLQSQPEIKHRF